MSNTPTGAPPQNLPKAIRLTYQAYFLLTVLEGIFLLWMLLRSPSMPGKSQLFGYSYQRLALAALIMVVIGGYLSIWVIFLKNSYAERIHLWLGNYFSKTRNSFWVISSLLASTLVTGFCLIVFYSPLSRNLNNVAHAIFQRVSPVIILLLLVSIQSFGLLVFLHRKHLSTHWAKLDFRIHLILLVIILFSSLQIVFIWARLAIREIFPTWIWDYWDKDIGIAYGWFPLLMLIVLITAFLVLRQPERQLQNLFLLLTLGYILQLGFGFMEGKGVKGLERKIDQSIPAAYVQEICHNPIPDHLLRDYDEVYGDRFWLGTKPPGYLMFFSSFKWGVEFFSPFSSGEDCFSKLTATAALLLPLISVITLIPLFFVSKSILGLTHANLALLLFISTPNFILMIANMDQFLFPLLSTITLLLIILAIKKCSLLLAFLAGVFIYIDGFFSFSLLPLGVFLASFLVIHLILNTEDIPRKSIIQLGIISLCGVAFTGLFFWKVFGYNAIQRYQHAIGAHRSIKEFQNGITQLVQALQLNNFEYGYWIGVPLVILVFVSGFMVLSNYRNRQSELADHFVLSFFVTYLVLNIFGQTIGEVGRLWIFLNPLTVIAASYALPKIVQKEPGKWTNLILMLQLCITLAIFTFQDMK